MRTTRTIRRPATQSRAVRSPSIYVRARPLTRAVAARRPWATDLPLAAAHGIDVMHRVGRGPGPRTCQTASGTVRLAAIVALAMHRAAAHPGLHRCRRRAARALPDPSRTLMSVTLEYGISGPRRTASSTAVQEVRPGSSAAITEYGQPLGSSAPDPSRARRRGRTTDPGWWRRCPGAAKALAGRVPGNPQRCRRRREAVRSNTAPSPQPKILHDAPSLPWSEHAKGCGPMKWPDQAADPRHSAAELLTTFTFALMPQNWPAEAGNTHWPAAPRPLWISRAPYWGVKSFRIRQNSHRGRLVG